MFYNFKRTGKHVLYLQILFILCFFNVNAVSAYQGSVQQLKAFSNAFVDVSKKVTPAVVSIRAKKKVSVSQFHNGRDLEEFNDFFRRFMPRDEEFEQSGLGSGFIIDKEGYILTNYHVVKDAVEMEVSLLDRRKFSAILIGTDPSTDVALIKIEGDNLPLAKLGNSENIQVGEWVIAIGTPFSEVLNYTVTAGIVSAIGRNLNIINSSQNSYKIEDFIQTDAAINPGNSGGPLVNLNGEVIGINTAILSNTGSYQGYGFAIPVNLVKNIASDLRNYGKVKRGIIGIQFQEIRDQKEMKEYKLKNPYGAKIEDFPFEDSPGKLAGLQKGDVIIAIDDKPFERSGQLQTIVSSKKPEDKVRLTYVRDGKVGNLVVTLGEIPAESEPLLTGVVGFPEIGISVNDTPEDQRPRNNEPKGVIITEVRRNSEADRNDVKIGDIIYKVDKSEINSFADFKETVEQSRNKSSIVLYLRNDEGHQLINLRLDR